MLTKKGIHIAYIGEPAKERQSGRKSTERGGFLDAMADASIWDGADLCNENGNCACRAVTKAAKI